MASSLTAGRALALVGFMAAGKSTVAAQVAARAGRPLVDVDAEVERLAGTTVARLFDEDGEQRFRELEAAVLAEALRRDDAPVLDLGGGAVLRPETRALLRGRALVAWLDVPLDDVRRRLGAAPDTRPLARDPAALAARYAERVPVYEAVADAWLDAAAPPEVLVDALLLGVWTRPGAVGLLPDLSGGRRAVLIADERLTGRVPGAYAATIAVAGGEEAKTVAALEGLWRRLAAADLERRDVVVCVGGGSVTDAGGFAAATFRRGLPWISVPSTLLGQVDAGIGGKTAINVAAKNDVGAFRHPEVVLCDPELLDSLPPQEWAGGLAEAVKTALIAGGRLWELVRALPPGVPAVEVRGALARRCAGVKALVVAEDPEERGRRAVLNLGHTIGHGIEAAAGYGGLTHGEAVAVGLSAALWLSERVRGLAPSVTAEVEEVLARHGLPVRAAGLAPDAVLAAMQHDKKRVAGEHRFVLLEAVGRPAVGVTVPAPLVREAVERAVR